jgi:hypothetical protein
MNTQVAQRNETLASRPLNVLAQLIHEQIGLAKDAAHEAAEKAATPYWLEIGRLCNEAKASPQMPRGGFMAWVNQQQFVVSHRQLNRWMVAAKDTTPDIQIRRSSIQQILRQILAYPVFTHTPKMWGASRHLNKALHRSVR